ncbi:hypothetical protein [Oenococcus oeni]|uniref:Uncharacterized protein n=1 Tax=Oenococcus oeni TaxID=1247 RepID=A0AAQ2UU87_OENOE|nr:hypothetical protein [Oenococcus oeni]EKP89527.1 hypothetical protein AWRIB129_718 [Oenococcus oeni DSM 20252 = AWRIB129]SYW07562.1 hypothetical protein OENI_780004 [Oenococcus oeni]SYW12308.1 hypothetical protein OENI_210004 [Oenococcus oeni]SYW14221.1 hypothetical protein OENI_390008 [Oenococcus oeni]SYW16133.1 hypothetical protein OENI_210008 [Oenococcus oeni]
MTRIKTEVFEDTKKSIDYTTLPSAVVNELKTNNHMSIKIDVYVYVNRLFLFVEEI